PPAGRCRISYRWFVPPRRTNLRARSFVRSRPCPCRPPWVWRWPRESPNRGLIVSNPELTWGLRLKLLGKEKGEKQIEKYQTGNGKQSDVEQHSFSSVLNLKSCKARAKKQGRDFGRKTLGFVRHVVR